MTKAKSGNVGALSGVKKSQKAFDPFAQVPAAQDEFSPVNAPNGGVSVGLKAFVPEAELKGDSSEDISSSDDFISIGDDWQWDDKSEGEPSAKTALPIEKKPSDNAANQSSNPSSSQPAKQPLKKPVKVQEASDWRQDLWLFLESAPRPLLPNKLLNAVHRTSFDRELVLALSSLSRARGRTDDAATVLDLALDKPALCCGHVRLIACVASMLFTRALMAPRSFLVLHKALEKFPNDVRLTNRELFASLRSTDFDTSAKLFQKRIEDARQKGNRKVAARLNWILGHLYESRKMDHFKAAECMAKAAALFMALGLPEKTYRAQSDAVTFLSQIFPPPRQLSLAIKALRTTAKAAGKMDDAEALIATLQLATAATNPMMPVVSGNLAHLDELSPKDIAKADAQFCNAPTLPPVWATSASEHSEKKPASPAKEIAPSANEPSEELTPWESEKDPFEMAVKRSEALGLNVPLAFSDQPTRPLQLSEIFGSEHKPDDSLKESSAHASEAKTGSQVPQMGGASDVASKAHSSSPSEKPTWDESAALEVKKEKHRLEEAVHCAPFDPLRYKELASFYVRLNRRARAQSIAEIAACLSGEGDDIETKIADTLGDDAWGQVLHPTLNACAAEIGSLIGPAVCEAISRTTGTFPIRGPFVMDGTDGAWSMADALLTAVRVLGLKSGTIYLWKEGELEPVSIIPTWPPGLCVSKPLLKLGLPAPVLRFFAGRSLAVMRPELQMYLLADPDRLSEIFDGLMAILERRSCLSPLVRAVARKISDKSANRLKWLLETFQSEGTPTFEFCRAARRTADRLGFLASGNLNAALKAMEFAQIASEERASLLEFAISDTCFQLRGG